MKSHTLIVGEVLPLPENQIPELTTYLNAAKQSKENANMANILTNSLWNKLAGIVGKKGKIELPSGTCNLGLNHYPIPDEKSAQELKIVKKEIYKNQINAIEAGFGRMVQEWDLYIPPLPTVKIEEPDDAILQAYNSNKINLTANNWNNIIPDMPMQQLEKLIQLKHDVKKAEKSNLLYRLKMEAIHSVYQFLQQEYRGVDISKVKIHLTLNSNETAVTLYTVNRPVVKMESEAAEPFRAVHKLWTGMEADIKAAVNANPAGYKHTPYFRVIANTPVTA